MDDSKWVQLVPGALAPRKKDDNGKHGGWSSAPVPLYDFHPIREVTWIKCAVARLLPPKHRVPSLDREKLDLWFSTVWVRFVAYLTLQAPPGDTKWGQDISVETFMTVFRGDGISPRVGIDLLHDLLKSHLDTTTT